MIRFENVGKILGGKPVLDGVNFQVAKGETFVIVGPSGVGKSVTLKHMVRLLTPDEGRVFVGRNASAKRPAASWNAFGSVLGTFSRAGLCWRGCPWLRT